jgi:phosphoserine phosphatase
VTGDVTLALFDLDKTLLVGDSFRLFGSLGAKGPVQRAILFAYAAVARIGIISNARYKELVLGAVWGSKGADGREVLLRAQLRAMHERALPAALAALRGYRERGDRVAVVTASPDLYVVPFVAEIDPGVVVLASEVEETPAGLRVENLFADAKALAAQQLIDSAAVSAIHVYTDHEHDIPMMQLAHRVVLVNPKPRTVGAVEKAGMPFEVVSW